MRPEPLVSRFVHSHVVCVLYSSVIFFFFLSLVPHLIITSFAIILAQSRNSPSSSGERVACYRSSQQRKLNPTGTDLRHCIHSRSRTEEWKYYWTDRLENDIGKSYSIYNVHICAVYTFSDTLSWLSFRQTIFSFSLLSKEIKYFFLSASLYNIIRYVQASIG